ncbi:tonB family C-terminal domain protein [Lysobacter antibioticus]|uniref:TonB family C-terminal domain protein n=1 Tax=Lysobacter antibioticus TaxID=84531 RepID=A0A0S2F9A0_LYSAN|nr:tonB family C-terminal domain protein [Lysobacter antibioticus]
MDGTRIAANAGAIAFNAAMLMLMLVPLSAPRLLVSEEEPIFPQFVPKKEVLIQPKPPKPELVKVVEKPRQQPVIKQQVQPVEAPPVVVDNPNPQPIDFAGAETVAKATPAVDLGPPIITGATLQSLKNPPPSYPPQAVREGLTGVVELEILVGIDGKPIDVSIVRSSGHRLLDQAARKVVLNRWTFQPAMSNGQPVQARGRVPIEFKLDQ